MKICWKIVENSMYESILPFIERLSHLKTLSLNDQLALIETNIQNVDGYSEIVIHHDVQFCSSSTFKIGFSSVDRTIIIEDAFINTLFQIFNNFEYFYVDK